MKETMKKFGAWLMAATLAFAGSAAMADDVQQPTQIADWFSAGFDGTDENWAIPTDAAEFDSKKIVIDTAADEEVVYTPAVIGKSSDKVTVKTAVEMTPVNALPEVSSLSGAQAAFTVLKDGEGLAYYGLAKVNDSAAWVKFTNATPVEDAEATVTIEFDYSSAKTVTYKVGDTALSDGTTTALPLADATKTTVTSIAYTGSGVASLLAGDYRDADRKFAVANVQAVGGYDYYATEPEAQNAAGEGNKYLAFNSSGTWDEKIAPVYVAEVNGQKYTTLAAALSAVPENGTLKLLRDVADIGAVSLKGITFDGNGKKITGASALYCAAAKETTIKNVVFENIHDAGGQLSAIYGEGFSTGAITITCCTFDNVDWDAIQIVPADGASGKIVIVDNDFKHTDETKSQLRYIHIQHMMNTDVHPVPLNTTITDNRFFDTGKSIGGEKISSILFSSVTGTLKVDGNYYDDRSTIYNDSIPLRMFYPMRSQPDVDVDDILFPLFSIEAETYATLADAVAAANQKSYAATIRLNGDLVVEETVEINNGSGKLVTFNAAGFNVQANVTMFNVKTMAAFYGDNAYPAKPGLVTCPSEGRVFNVDNGVSFVIQNAVFSKDVKYLVTNPHKDVCVQRVDGNYEIKTLTDELALAQGYVVRNKSTSANAEYYASVSELISGFKSAGKTSATIGLIAADVNEDIDVSGMSIMVYAGNYTYTGSVMLDDGKFFGAYSGNVHLTNLNCGPLYAYGGKLVVDNGKAASFGCNSPSDISIKGGTYGSDPTAYVDTENYEVIENPTEPKTWTVQVASRTITVTTTAEAQAALDAAKKGDTIVFAAGDYGTIYIRNNGDEANRILENVTLVAAEGAEVTVDEFYHQQVAGKSLDIENLVIDGFSFDDPTVPAMSFDVNGSSSTSGGLRVNGLTVKNCTKVGNNATKAASGQSSYNEPCFAVFHYDSATPPTVYTGDASLQCGYHNIQILSNDITQVYMPIAFLNSGILDGLTVVGNTFTDCTDNHIQKSGDKTSGAFIIKDNVIVNMTGRFARISGATADATFTIKNNTVTTPRQYDTGGDPDIFKITGAAGFTVSEKDNQWLAGSYSSGGATWIAAGDPALLPVAKIGNDFYSTLADAVVAYEALEDKAGVVIVVLDVTAEKPAGWKIVQGDEIATLEVIPFETENDSGEKVYFETLQKAYDASKENGMIRIRGTGTYKMSVNTQANGKKTALLDVGSATLNYDAYNLGGTSSDSVPPWDVATVNIGHNGKLAIVTGYGQSASTYCNSAFTSADATAVLQYTTYGNRLYGDNSGFKGTMIVNASVPVSICSDKSLVKKMEINGSLAIDCDLTMAADSVVTGSGNITVNREKDATLNGDFTGYAGTFGGRCSQGDGIMRFAAAATFPETGIAITGSQPDWPNNNLTARFEIDPTYDGIINASSGRIFLNGNTTAKLGGAATGNRRYVFGSYGAETVGNLDHALTTENVIGTFGAIENALYDLTVVGQGQKLTGDAAVTLTGVDFTGSGYHGVYGAGSGATVGGGVNVTMSSGSGSQIAGALNAGISGETKITVNGGTLNNLFGIENPVAAGSGDITLVINGGSVGNVYGAQLQSGEAHGATVGQVGDVTVSVIGGTVTGGVRGGNRSAVTGIDWTGYRADSVTINLGGGEGTATIDATVYGTSSLGVDGNITVNVKDNALVSKDIYAGSKYASTTGKTIVNVTGGSVSGKIYGGSAGSDGSSAAAEVNVSGGTVTGTIYANGSSGDTISGNATVSVSGGAVNDLAVDAGTVNGQTIASVTGGSVNGNITGFDSVSLDAALTMGAGKIVSCGAFSNAKAVTMTPQDGVAAIAFSATFENTGSLTFDLTGATAESIVLVDNAGSATMTLADYGTVAITGSDAYIPAVVNGDLCAVKPVAEITVGGVTTKYATLQEAVDVAGDRDVTIIVLGDPKKLTPPTGWKFKTEGGVTTLVKNPVAVAEIVGKEGAYPSLGAAVAAAVAGDTIRMLCNATESTSIDIEKNLTIDLDGTTLTFAQYGNRIGDDALVTFKNGDIAFAKGGATPAYGAAFHLRGELTLDAISIKIEDCADYAFDALFHLQASNESEQDARLVTLNLNNSKIELSGSAVNPSSIDVFQGYTQSRDGAVVHVYLTGTKVKMSYCGYFAQYVAQMNLNNSAVEIDHAQEIVSNNNDLFTLANVSSITVDTCVSHALTGVKLVVNAGCTVDVKNAGYLGLNTGDGSVFKAGSVVRAANCCTKSDIESYANKDIAIRANGKLTIEAGADVICDGVAMANGEASSIDIAGGCFKKVDAGAGTITLTGGVYVNEPNHDYAAEGYEVQANVEPFTKDDYPYAVAKKAFVPVDEKPITIDITPAGGTQAIVPVTVSEDAVEKMVTAGIVTPAGETATAAEVSEGLAKKQDNEQTVWQNYVMGVDGTTKQNVLATIGEKQADKPEEVVVVKTPIAEFNPPQNTGVTVTYNLLRKGPNETKFTVYQEGLLKPEVDVNTIELELGDTLWKFEAVFSAEKPQEK